MAENKKSVLLYIDLIHTVEKLDNETAGLLFKHYLRYVNDLNPKTDSLIVEIAFESMKQNLKRDLKKWEKRAENSRLNGKKGGRPKTQETQRVKKEPKEPVIVTVTVKDTVIKNTNNYVLADFKKSLQSYSEEFSKDMINEFYLYWTEKKPRGRKMRFEMEKTFDIGRRLKRWSDNNFNKPNKNEKRKAIGEITRELRQNERR